MKTKERQNCSHVFHVFLALNNHFWPLKHISHPSRCLNQECSLFELYNLYSFFCICVYHYLKKTVTSCVFSVVMFFLCACSRISNLQVFYFLSLFIILCSLLKFLSFSVVHVKEHLTSFILSFSVSVSFYQSLSLYNYISTFFHSQFFVKSFTLVYPF